MIRVRINVKPKPWIKKFYADYRAYFFSYTSSYQKTIFGKQNVKIDLHIWYNKYSYLTLFSHSLPLRKPTHQECIFGAIYRSISFSGRCNRKSSWSVLVTRYVVHGRGGEGGLVTLSPSLSTGLMNLITQSVYRLITKLAKNMPRDMHIAQCTLHNT
jgi:hypothetical protein